MYISSAMARIIPIINVLTLTCNKSPLPDPCGVLSLFWSTPLAFFKLLMAVACIISLMIFRLLESSVVKNSFKSINNKIEKKKKFCSGNRNTE